MWRRYLTAYAEFLDREVRKLAAEAAAMPSLSTSIPDSAPDIRPPAVESGGDGEQWVMGRGGRSRWRWQLEAVQVPTQCGQVFFMCYHCKAVPLDTTDDVAQPRD